ncbi:hypothetical protein [Bacillus aerolatus]|uniref:hypothetical protein n=1 Tax=Bacillus aerolatus TaxID=2653354 RepID=UPI0017849F9C|nr:hypothetical protein [Bacillus aerolatus]
MIFLVKPVMILRETLKRFSARMEKPYRQLLAAAEVPGENGGKEDEFSDRYNR